MHVGKSKRSRYRNAGAMHRLKGEPLEVHFLSTWGHKWQRIELGTQNECGV